MPKSLWDWIAYTGIWLAAIFEGVWYYSDVIPSVTVHAPQWLTWSGWAVAPLVLLTASGLIMAVRAIRARYVPTPPPPVSQSDRPAGRTPMNRVTLLYAALWLIVPIGGASALGYLVVSAQSANALRLASDPLMRLPPVVRGSVTLAYVQQIERTQDPVAAEQTLDRFLGTDMRVAGIVHESTDRGDWSRILTLTQPKAVPTVYIVFAQAAAQQGSVDRLRPGDHVAADCKVERLDAAALGLDGCQVVSEDAWTAAPVSNATY